MSYDIAAKAKLDGVDQWVNLYAIDANITWNVGPMIRACTGLEWKNEADNGLGSEIIPHIETGLRELIEHPDKYRKMESPNGWGTIDGTVRFFKKILRDWYSFVEDNPMVASVAHFWIE